MSQIRHIKDHIASSDSADLVKRQLWADTEIIAGYGYHGSNDPFVLSYLDEPIWPEPKHNTVPISGVQTLLEMAFGVKGHHSLFHSMRTSQVAQHRSLPFMHQDTLLSCLGSALLVRQKTTSLYIR